MSEAYDFEGQTPNVARLGEKVADPLLVQWARFRDQFAAAVENRQGFWTLEDLEAKIAAHVVFFFPGRVAAMVGQIDAYPGGENAFRVTLQVGDPLECGLILPGVEALARMMGCTSMLVERAPGDDLPGYEPFMLMLHKAL